jgi:chitinase
MMPSVVRIVSCLMCLSAHALLHTNICHNKDEVLMIYLYAFLTASSHPGPNAPLSDICGNSSEPEANAVYGYDAFVRAGIPAHQLMLGVPSYGYISRSSVTALQDRRRRRNSASTAVINEDNNGTTSGTIQFSSLVTQGALIPMGKENRNGDPIYEGSDGFERRWDTCSSTPWIENAAIQQVVTYDDPVSLGLKAAFSLDVGMKGVALWDVHGDTDDWALTDAIRRALKLPAVAKAILESEGQQGLGVTIVRL